MDRNQNNSQQHNHHHFDHHLWMSVPQYPYETSWENHSLLPLHPPPPATISRCDSYCHSTIIPKGQYAIQAAASSPMRPESSSSSWDQSYNNNNNTQYIDQTCSSQDTMKRYGITSVVSPNIRNSRIASDNNRINGNNNNNNNNNSDYLLHNVTTVPQGAATLNKNNRLAGVGLQTPIEEAEQWNRGSPQCHMLPIESSDQQKVDTAIPSIRAEKGSEKCDSIRSSDSDSAARVGGTDNGCDRGVSKNENEAAAAPAAALSNLNHSTLADFLEVNANQLEYVDMSLLNRALLDCYGRFLLNLPSSLLRDHVHLQFQIQEGHWWYEDFWYDVYPEKLPKINLKAFGLLMCESFSTLRECVPKDVRGRLVKDWVLYCKTIPLRGAIILNSALSKCLLVQGWKGNRWTFPRGKVDEEESDETCAIREVLEEIGFDVSNMISKELFIEKRLGKQCVKLFIVCGMSEKTTLGPQKRKEISEIRWVPISSLPDTVKMNNNRNTRHPTRGSKGRASDSGQQSASSGMNNGKIRFTHVAGFVQGILAWLKVLESRLNDFNGRFPTDATLLTSHLEWAHLRRLQHPDGVEDANDPEDDHEPGDDKEEAAKGSDRERSGQDSPKTDPQQHEVDDLSHTADDLLAVLLGDRAAAVTSDKKNSNRVNPPRSTSDNRSNAQNTVPHGDRLKPSNKANSNAPGFKTKLPAMRSVGVSAVQTGYGEKVSSVISRKKGQGKHSPVNKAKNWSERGDDNNANASRNDATPIQPAAEVEELSKSTGELTAKAADEKATTSTVAGEGKAEKKSEGNRGDLEVNQPANHEHVTRSIKKDTPNILVRTKVKLLSRSTGGGESNHTAKGSPKNEVSEASAPAGVVGRPQDRVAMQPKKISPSRPLMILKRGDKV